jgi:hypothetical protein
VHVVVASVKRPRARDSVLWWTVRSFGRPRALLLLANHQHGAMGVGETVLTH